MYALTSIILYCLILSSILLLLTFLINNNSILMLEKCSPFECGFNPNFFFRIPFSIQFFLIALLFLIFDIELILLYPFLLNNTFMLNFFQISFCIAFFLLLFLGLLHEWNQNSLQWN